MKERMGIDRNPDSNIHGFIWLIQSSIVAGKTATDVGRPMMIWSNRGTELVEGPLVVVHALV